MPAESPFPGTTSASFSALPDRRREIVPPPDWRTRVLRSPGGPDSPDSAVRVSGEGPGSDRGRSPT